VWSGSISVNNGIEAPMTSIHLGNRRGQTWGADPEPTADWPPAHGASSRRADEHRSPRQMTPISLINIRPVGAATREFFGGSQLSTIQAETNHSDELTHKRRLSALGPGGLRRERAGLTSVMSTTLTMAVSAPSRHRKVPTLAHRFASTDA